MIIIDICILATWLFTMIFTNILFILLVVNPPFNFKPWFRLLTIILAFMQLLVVTAFIMLKFLEYTFFILLKYMVL